MFETTCKWRPDDDTCIEDAGTGGRITDDQFTLAGDSSNSSMGEQSWPNNKLVKSVWGLVVLEFVKGAVSTGMAEELLLSDLPILASAGPILANAAASRLTVESDFSAEL